MKALILALFFTLTAGINGFAGSVSNVKDHNDLVRAIQKQLHFTEQLRKKACNATAVVNFIVNDNGQIEIKEIKSESPVLKEDILRQMENMPISRTPVYPNTLYTLKISLKKEK